MKKPKIAFLDANTVGVVPEIKNLEKLGHVTLYPGTTIDQTCDRILGQDIIITNKVVIDASVINRCPELKLICIAATGTNNVDIEFAEKNNIRVKNVVNYSSNSVAWLTLAMMSNLAKLNVPLNYYDNYAKTEYIYSETFCHIGPAFQDFEGKQVGIIGLGNIGTKVANVLSNLGAEICYYSTSGKNNNDEFERIELSELLTRSDIVTIHAPLNEQTKNLITIEELKLMKKSALLINMGRGGIVNETDLAQAIDENLIAAAGVDVLENEPILIDSPLLKIKNMEKILITPHIGWASVQARRNLINRIYDNISQFLLENPNLI